MAAAVAGPLLVSQLTADIGALMGLGTHPAQTREEVFAPYCGRWIKDKEASESMAACCQLLGFSTILQHAVRLIKGLEINMHNGVISVSVCSFISWFKITERYPIDGSEVKNNRRDMRGGGMMTNLTGNGDKVHLRMQWGGNYAGGGEDELYMPNPNELHIITKIWVNDDPNSPKQARQVYRRIT